MRSEFITWLRIGLLSFGGPAAHIALIHSEICSRLKWARERDFVQGLSFATLLPGPEAMQLGVYLGWRYGGVKSAVIAGLGFVLPGAALMIALTVLLSTWRSHTAIEAVLAGVQPVIAAFVFLALWRIARQTVKSVPGAVIALASFIALYGFGVSFLLIALVAAAWGLLVMPVSSDADPDIEATTSDKSNTRQAVWILGIGLAAGFSVTAATFLLPEPVYHEIALHLATAVLVVFGGAYAVIGYVADQAVGQLGWMTAAQVIDGLALAETAPGPLILFNTYAGTMAAAQGGFAAALLGGMLATVVTFLPSFVLVLAGAPFVAQLYENRWLRRALAGVAAAVIGLIASLAVLLASTVLWSSRGLNFETTFIALLALLILATRLLPAPLLIALGAIVGLLRWGLIGA